MQIQATCMYYLVVKTGVQVCASIIPLFLLFRIFLSFFCSCHLRMVITHQEAEVFPVGMTSETKRSNMLHYMRLLFSLLSSSTLFSLQFFLCFIGRKMVSERCSWNTTKSWQVKDGYLVKENQINLRPATSASSCCLCLNEIINIKVDWIWNFVCFLSIELEFLQLS